MQHLSVRNSSSFLYFFFFILKTLLCRDHSKICKVLHSKRIKFSTPSFSKQSIDICKIWNWCWNVAYFISCFWQISCLKLKLIHFKPLVSGYRKRSATWNGLNIFEVGGPFVPTVGLHTAQKMRFSIKDFLSKCDQIPSLLRIWSNL